MLEKIKKYKTPGSNVRKMTAAKTKHTRAHPKSYTEMQKQDVTHQVLDDCPPQFHVARLVREKTLHDSSKQAAAPIGHLSVLHAKRSKVWREGLLMKQTLSEKKSLNLEFYGVKSSSSIRSSHTKSCALLKRKIENQRF